MSSAITAQPPGKSAFLLRTRPAFDMTPDEFFNFCQINNENRIERSADGDLIVMAPTGGSTGSGNFELAMAFASAAEARETGRFFDSSTGFDLPNGATRSPDLSWVPNERLNLLTDAEWKRFLPLCPDFVLELRSPSDELAPLVAKMVEYLENGTRLGWLIDPANRGVIIYRPGAEPEILETPATVSGGEVLPGFELELAPLWKAIFRE
jgi:Uma2 family endonuclease